MPFFVPQLKTNGGLNQTHMTIANIGSRKISREDDYASSGWGLFAPNLTIYGFDADADACEAANADLEARQITWNERHLPLALGAAIGEATLHVTKDPMCSSLYQPNEPYLVRFAGLSEVMSEDFSIGLDITTLDQICQTEAIPAIDFLQVDVQGADLQVLKGAAELLERSILAIQVEVEFSHLYHDQPLFANVDIYLREQGFTLFDLSMAYRLRARSPIQSSLRTGQILWGDAFYFRDLIQEEDNSPLKTPEQLFKLACIADILEFQDYGLELLEYLTLNYGSNPTYNFANLIVERLAQFPELVDRGLSSLPIVNNLRKFVIGDTLKLLP
ncbi:MAG: FkbM family methyltransferase [Kovacikia sp.]